MLKDRFEKKRNKEKSYVERKPFGENIQGPIGPNR
jgi:hypothetical protein